MGKKAVTLGEIMLGLSTPGNTRFVQSDSFDVVYGGGEANVAVSCATVSYTHLDVYKRQPLSQVVPLARVARAMSAVNWAATGSPFRFSLSLLQLSLIHIFFSVRQEALSVAYYGLI